MVKNRQGISKRRIDDPDLARLRFGSGQQCAPTPHRNTSTVGRKRRSAIDGMAVSDGLGETNDVFGHRLASSTARFICSTQLGITRRYDAGFCSGART